MPNPAQPAQVKEALSLEQMRDAVYAALRLKLGPMYCSDGPGWSVVATYEDSVVVQTAPGKLFKYPVTVATDGDVTLGEPTPSTVEYPEITATEARDAKFREACAPSLDLAVERFRETLAGARIMGPISLAEGKAKPGSKWAVAVLCEGVSANRRLYTREALEGSIAKFENARVYWNHVSGGAAAMRDPRDIAGFLTHPKLAMLEGKATIVAELNATSKQARQFLRESFEAGRPDLAGLSIDAEGKGEAMRTTEGSVLRVDAITRVHSVDIVSEPAAGGRFLKLVAGMPSQPVTDQEFEMLEQKLLKLKESHPELHKLLSATPTESEVDTLLRVAEAKVATPPAPTVVPPAAPVPATVPAAGAETLKLHEARVRRLVIKATVDTLLEGRTLPDAFAAPTRKQVERLVEAGLEDEAKAYVDSQVELAAKLAEGQTRTGTGTALGGTHEVTISGDSNEKLTRALDGLFAGEDIKEGSTTFPRFTSIREAYIQMTGDTRVTGRMSEAHLRRFAGVRVLEGTREDHTLSMQEAITTTGFANVLASSLNRQLVREYNAENSLYGDSGRGWLYTVVPANDFRSRDRVRFGGYANLPAVSQTGTYQPLTSPTDEHATYAVTKRGGLETLSFEAIKNDDVGFVQRIPKRLAMAALRTHYEFCHDMYRTNAAIYDGNNLFDNANHQNNLGAAPLSKAAFSAARIAIQKMTEKDSSKRLGLILRHLMVPVDLQETAFNMFRMVATASTTANFEPDFIETMAKAVIHVIAHSTDTNDWFACVGADQCEQIEMGYLDGREDPEIFVADLPNAGSLFFADKIDYKIRHIYSGAVLDYRGFFGAYGI